MTGTKEEKGKEETLSLLNAPPYWGQQNSSPRLSFYT